MPLVDTFALRYERAGASYDDLMHAGSTGLLDAIQRFAPGRGEEFIGFAVPIIVGEIKAHLRERVGNAVTPAARQEARGRQGVGGGAAARGEEPPPGRGHPGNGHPEFDLRDERVQLAGGFRALDQTEHAIIRLRFVDDLSSEQTARRLGISEEQLSRHTQAALAKLRGELERPGSGQPPAATPPAKSRAPNTPSERPAVDAKDSHSGRLLLRMPQSLHTKLAQAAEREEVSLNQFITNTLAAAMGWQQADDQQDSDGPESPAPAPRWLPAAIVTNIVVVVVAGIVAVVLLIVALQQGW
jgi:RNA polymerase sigma-B factor